MSELRDELVEWLAQLMHQRDGHKRRLGYRGKGETLRGDDLCDYWAARIVDDTLPPDIVRALWAGSAAEAEEKPDAV